MEQPNKNIKLVSNKNSRVILPNTLTLIGVCIGLSSIKFAFDGKFELSVIAVIYFDNEQSWFPRSVLYKASKNPSNASIVWGTNANAKANAQAEEKSNSNNKSGNHNSEIK